MLFSGWEVGLCVLKPRAHTLARFDGDSAHCSSPLRFPTPLVVSPHVCFPRSPDA